MPGSIITVVGRVDVLYEGHIFGAFIEDIKVRADLIEAKHQSRKL
jgi:hypothetical protein